MGLGASGEFGPFQSGTVPKITCNAPRLQDTLHYSARESLLICCLSSNHKHINGAPALSERARSRKSSGEEMPAMRVEPQPSFPGVRPPSRPWTRAGNRTGSGQAPRPSERRIQLSSSLFKPFQLMGRFILMRLRRKTLTFEPQNL